MFNVAQAFSIKKGLTTALFELRVRPLKNSNIYTRAMTSLTLSTILQNFGKIYKQPLN